MKNIFLRKYLLFILFCFIYTLCVCSSLFAQYSSATSEKVVIADVPLAQKAVADEIVEEDILVVEENVSAEGVSVVEEVVAEVVDPRKVQEDFDKTKFDFTDNSSWNLSVSAWENLAENNYEGVYAFANECLIIYEDDALKISKDMRRFPGMGHEDESSVLNDVGACYYILGEAAMRQEQYDKAIKYFQTAIDKFPYAMCWDPKGWFWKIAEISEINIQKCEKAKKI